MTEDELEAELMPPRDRIDQAIRLAVQLINQALDTLVGLGTEESDALLRDALGHIRDAQVHNQLLRGMP